MKSGHPDFLLNTFGQRAHQRHDHNTRRADSFTLPAIRVEAGRRRLCYRGVSLLNDSGIEPGTLSFRADARLFAGSL